MLSKGRSDIVTTGNDLTLRDGYSDEVTLRAGANVVARVLTLPVTSADDTLVSATSTVTLTGKTLTSPKINENVALTSTSTKLNYLTNATGTTGTDTTNIVFSTSPTLVTPTLGVASATSINKVTLTAPASGATLTIADGKTLTCSNTLTFTGTDASSVAFGTGGTVTYTSNKLSVFSATTSAELAGVISDETGSGALVFATSPSLTTPNIGAAIASSIDVASAAALPIGATVGANNLTLGGAASTVVIPGNLEVQGTTVTLNTATLDVEDVNIAVNKGGTNGSANGAGLTITKGWDASTDGTLIWDTTAKKFKAGQSGSEIELVDLSSSQILTTKTLTTPDINGGTADSLTSLSVRDTSAAYDVTLTATSSSALTAGRTLTLDMVNAARSIKLQGNLDVGGNLTTANSFTTSGNYALTLTQTGATNVTLPTTGTLATLGGTETLAAKTLTAPQINGGTASNTTQWIIPKNTTSNLGSLTKTEAALVYSSDEDKLFVGDGTDWKAVGSGAGASGRNYLSDWFDGAKSVGSVTNSITATGNVTISTTAWQASDTSKLTVANVTSAGIRGDAMTNSGAKSLKLDHVAVGTAFVQSPNFQLDLVDAGKPVMVRFDHGAVTTADDFQVMMVRYNSSGTYQEQINIAGTASATSPYSARLAAGSITTFNGFFIAGSTTTDYYALRFYRNNASDTTDIQIDSLYVGPQSVVQGAAVTDWVSFTPALTASGGGAVSIGTGGNAEATGFWRRQGDSMQIRVRWQWGTTSTAFGTSGYYQLTMPSGYSVDESKFHTKGCQIGYGNIFDSDLADLYGVAAIYDPSSNDIYFNVEESTTGVTFGKTAPFTTASSDWLHAQLTVPIVGWSSNVTMANRAVERYFYTSESFDAAGSTTVEGIDGQATTNITVGSRAKTLTIPGLQATDRVTLELRYQNTNIWFEAQQLAPLFLNATGTGIAGTYVSSATSTTVVVTFLQYKWASSDDSPTTDWGTDLRWRVRVTSGGASVGYPIHADNIVVDHNTTQVTSAIESGTYTVTVTGGTNVAAVTNGTGSYIRVGKVVHCSGNFLVDPTAAGDFDVDLSIPIASDFTATTDAAGVGCAQSQTASARITADATDNRLTLYGATGSASNQNWAFTATYVIN